MKCPICSEDFEAYKGMRADARLRFWCKADQDKFDSIDWEEVYNQGQWDRYNG